MKFPLSKKTLQQPFRLTVFGVLILNSCGLERIPLSVAVISETARTSHDYKDVLYSSSSYSLDHVQTYRFDLSCDNTKFVRIQSSLKEEYCGRLDAGLKESLEKEFPEWRFDKDNPDIWIQAELKAAWGGPNPYKGIIAHLYVSRMSYVAPIIFIKIIRWGTVIAEYRLMRSSRHSIPFFMEKSTNDIAFMNTVGDVSNNMVQFIIDPNSFETISKEELDDLGL